MKNRKNSLIQVKAHLVKEAKRLTKLPMYESYTFLVRS